MDLQLIDETKHVTDHQLDLVRGVLEYAANYLSLPENTEMSVTLMDNKHIHEINKKYRGIDKPTDVISFAMEEDGDEDDIILPSDMEFEMPKNLGDLMISMEKVAEQIGRASCRERVSCIV